MRFGGLGLANPTDTCEPEYQTSLKVTGELSKLIYDQQQDLSLFDPNAKLSVIKDLKKEKELMILRIKQKNC